MPASRFAVVLLALVAALMLCLAAGPTRATAAPPTAAQSELISTYSPIVRLKEQEKACGPGEPFQPTDVDLLMDNDDVALRGPWSETNLVAVAPSAEDLSRGLDGYNLDFPGDALDPGCTYEEWANRLTAGSPPTVYGRVVTQEDRPGQLALQYWLFYPYNDFTNKHEGDWEMIQIVFEADDATGALAAGPSQTGYSQHESAERASWGDSKLEVVDGTHPVVYPAAGSHANYYSSALYLGRNAAEGLGCDDTTGPSSQILPVVDGVATPRADYLPEYPWLGYDGRWGERHPGFYNGPTGPNTKEQWTRPISWAEETWRDQSFAVPAGGAGGTTATGFFCGAVTAGSDLLRALTQNPPVTVVVIVLFVLLIIWLATRTAWRPSAPLRIGRRRSIGQVIAASWRMYAGHLWLFLGIGLLFIPLGIVITGLQYLLFRLGSLEPLVLTAGEQDGLVAGLALAMGTLLSLLAYSIVVAAVARAMIDLDAGRRATPLTAYRASLSRWRPLLAAVGVAVLVQALLGLTVIGIPLGLFLLVRWSLLAVVVDAEERTGLRALRRSASLVRGHWLKTLVLVVGVGALALAIGPLVGALILLATGAAFNFVNALASIVYVLVMPFAAIATTYVYLDLRAREQEVPAPARNEPLPAEVEIEPGAGPSARPG